MLTDYAILDGAELDRPVLLVSWTRHAISEITVHDLATGERTGTLALPGPGRTGGTAGWAPPAESAPGPRAATRPGSATPTTPRR